MKSVALTFRGLIFAAGAFMLASGAGQAAEFERNIMTGGPTGTYIRIGKDIAALGATCGQTLNVIESAGSLENFVGVRKRRSIFCRSRLRNGCRSIPIRRCRN